MSDDYDTCVMQESESIAEDGPVAIIVRSKALVCSRLNAEIVGSNPAEGTDVRVLFFMSCIGSGLYNGLITRSDETYHVCVDVIVCGPETSKEAA